MGSRNGGCGACWQFCVCWASEDKPKGRPSALGKGRVAALGGEPSGKQTLGAAPERAALLAATLRELGEVQSQLEEVRSSGPGLRAGAAEGDPVQRLQGIATQLSDMVSERRTELQEAVPPGGRGARPRVPGITSAGWPPEVVIEGEEAMANQPCCGFAVAGLHVRGWVHVNGAGSKADSLTDILLGGFTPCRRTPSAHESSCVDDGRVAGGATRRSRSWRSSRDAGAGAAVEEVELSLRPRDASREKCARAGSRCAPVPPAPDLVGKSGAREASRKPFFRDWADFMEFDETFKHKTPITPGEFDLLLQKEEESNVGWDVCVDQKDIRVAKRQMGVGGITVRAWGTVPGVNLHVAFYLFYNIEQRMKWDRVFDKMEIIDSDVEGSDILYSLLKVPGVTQRDFVQYRRVRVQDDGSIVIVLRSAQHLGAPEDGSSIRAESYISGYVLRQEFEGSKPVLRIFLMSCTDVKGMIPKWIISYFAPKKPGEWINGLRKAAMEYQAAHPNFKEDLAQYVQRYACGAVTTAF